MAVGPWATPPAPGATALHRPLETRHRQQRGRAARGALAGADRLPRPARRTVPPERRWERRHRQGGHGFSPSEMSRGRLSARSAATKRGQKSRTAPKDRPAALTSPPSHPPRPGRTARRTPRHTPTPPDGTAKNRKTGTTNRPPPAAAARPAPPPPAAPPPNAPATPPKKEQPPHTPTNQPRRSQPTQPPPRAANGPKPAREGPRRQGRAGRKDAPRRQARAWIARAALSPGIRGAK